MLQLNYVEQEAIEILCILRDYFSKPKLGRQQFTDIMGHVRNAIQHLENKRFGCYTGLHSSECTCTPTSPGTTLNMKFNLKYTAKKRLLAKADKKNK